MENIESPKAKKTIKIITWSIIGVFCLIFLIICSSPNEPEVKEPEVKHELVFNEPETGSVAQVWEYLQKNLKDANSYESVKWGQATKTDNGFMVWHTYRAKNSFGALEITKQMFTMDKQGNVINVEAME